MSVAALPPAGAVQLAVNPFPPTLVAAVAVGAAGHVVIVVVNGLVVLYIGPPVHVTLFSGNNVKVYAVLAVKPVKEIGDAVLTPLTVPLDDAIAVPAV